MYSEQGLFFYVDIADFCDMYVHGFDTGLENFLLFIWGAVENGF